MADNIAAEQKADLYMNSVDKGYNGFLVGRESVGDKALQKFQEFLNEERKNNPEDYKKELNELKNDNRYSVHRGGPNNADLVLEFDSCYGKRNGTP